MTETKIRELPAADEGFTVEYKECTGGLNDSVFETVASFSNRDGGYLLLGVREIDGKGAVSWGESQCGFGNQEKFHQYAEQSEQNGSIALFVIG